VDWIRQWWRQPDHFDWLSAYLGARNLLRFTRFIVAAVVLLLGVAPLLMLLSPAGPQSTMSRLISIFAAAVCGIMAVMWATQWPTRRQSLVFTGVLAVCIAAGCLVQSTPVAGLQGATAFAALAGYVAFFHTSRALLLTLAVSATTATICAVQIATHLDPFAALSKLLILTVGVLAVPYSAEINDITMMVSHHHESDVLLDRTRDAFDRLYLESKESTRILAIGVHPYVTGQAHRIKYFEQLYAYINKHPGVVHWTGQQIYDWYVKQVPKPKE